MIPNFVVRNPWSRAFVPLVLAAVVGVASNTLIVQIASGSAINWSLLPQVISTYLILVSLALAAVYQVAVSRHDGRLLRGFTPKQYEASIRNAVAEKVASRSKKLINEGKIEQLETETEVFRRLYGEGR